MFGPIPADNLAPPSAPTYGAILRQAWDEALRISQGRAQALLQAIMARGQAEVAYLQSRGQELLRSLSVQGQNALTSFVQQAMYDLDRNRGLTPGEQGYRAGYAGVRQYAPVVTEADARALPGYGSIERANQEKVTSAGTMLGIDLAHSQALTQAELARQQALSSLDEQEVNARYSQQMQQSHLPQGGGGGGGGKPGGVGAGEDRNPWRTGFPDDFPSHYSNVTGGLGQGAVQPSSAPQFARGGATAAPTVPTSSLDEARARARQKHTRRTHKGHY